ncbi:hypothetical protein GCM10027600_39320 [Nocardioides ginsengisegetis]
MAVALILTATACTGPGSASDPAHDAWTARDALPSCGRVRMDQGDSLQRASADGMQCLLMAMRSGEGGEFVLTRPTTEGDPITTYYRVLPDGTFETYVDNTADHYGSGRWEYRRCSTRSPSLSPC